ncbi:MAG TPA: cellulase family glycosylhydrolase, partial [Chloroflexota bacterium]
MVVDVPPARTIPRRRPGVPNPAKWSRRVFGAFAAMVAAWLLLTLVPGRQPLVVDIAPPRRPAGTPGLAWLATDGNAIVDDQGRAVLLRGFNTAALLHWPRQPVAPLDDMDLELMRGAGFDVVRLPIAWSKLEPERGSIDAAYLDDIDRTVRQINDHDLYVVLDMHVTLGWSPRFGGAGAPDWATLPFIPHVAFAAPGEWTEMLSPAVAAATDYFWLSPDWQTDLSDIWRAV